MNGRITKLLRRYCATVKPRLSFRSAKRWWNSEPRTERPALRRMMQDSIETYHLPLTTVPNEKRYIARNQIQ